MGLSNVGIDLTTYLSTISAGNLRTSAGVNYVNGNLDKILNGSNAALSQQYDMQDIVSNETQRLSAKQQQIDNALTGKNRMIALNENYREKYARYNWIMIVVVITLALLVFLIMIQRYFIFIPSAIIDLLIAVLLASSGVYIVWVVVDISNRDNMNFSELNLTAPPLDGNAITGNAILNTGMNLNLNTCLGSACCATMEDWNPEIGQCVGNLRTGILITNR
jgi:hypothetical protein